MLKSIYVFMLSLLTSLLHGAGAPVYIVGYLEGNTKDATLWITDISASSPKPVILENQIGDSGAYSLTAINNQLFCLVVQTDNQQTIPTLCITDTSGSSPQPVQLTGFTPSYSAGAITSVNNKIFCSGSSLQYATSALLIFDSLNQSQSIITLGTENYTSFGNAVIHENNKIYCGGYQTESSDQYATLWITNPSGENLKTVQLDKGPESTVYALTTSNNKIYCVGEVNKSATLWITNSDGSNTLKISLENVVNNTPAAITVKNGLLYILSFQEHATNTLSITILDASGTFKTSIALGGTYGTSIQSFGNQIFAVGFQGPQANPTATLWVTDTTGSSVSSYTIAPSPSTAAGIYIPQQETPTFYQALQKFSPVHFQKGI